MRALAVDVNDGHLRDALYLADLPALLRRWAGLITKSDTIMRHVLIATKIASVGALAVRHGLGGEPVSNSNTLKTTPLSHF